jgi:hypothetical protein
MGQLVKGWAAELSLANEIGIENRRSSTKWAVGRISEHFPQKHITPFFFSQIQPNRNHKKLHFEYNNPDIHYDQTKLHAIVNDHRTKLRIYIVKALQS